MHNKALYARHLLCKQAILYVFIINTWDGNTYIEKQTGTSRRRRPCKWESVPHDLTGVAVNQDFARSFWKGLIETGFREVQQRPDRLF